MEAYRRSEAGFIEVNATLYALAEMPRPRGMLTGDASYVRAGAYLIAYRIDDERRVLRIADIRLRG